MRIPNHPTILGLAAAFALAGVALPAAAGSFYRYETENGGIAYTDDAKRIPARYRDAAEQIASRSLDDFERFTPMAPSQPAPYAARLNERLAYLRALNAGGLPDVAAAGPYAQPAPSAQPGVTIRSSGRANVVETTTPHGSGAPTVVDTVRVRPNGSNITELWTVVRQGDEIISVVQPRSRQQDSRWLRESDLLD